MITLNASLCVSRAENPRGGRKRDGMGQRLDNETLIDIGMRLPVWVSTEVEGRGSLDGAYSVAWPLLRRGNSLHALGGRAEDGWGAKWKTVYPVMLLNFFSASRQRTHGDAGGRERSSISLRVAG